ncbi:hypothetical protein DA2_2383 [Desulfovibrio sp. A2]|nr:hypothetical protein DA2_2383 [Desulfovibrio sp. A2]
MAGGVFWVCPHGAVACPACQSHEAGAALPCRRVRDGAACRKSKREETPVAFPPLRMRALCGA